MSDVTHFKIGPRLTTPEAKARGREAMAERWYMVMSATTDRCLSRLAAQIVLAVMVDRQATHKAYMRAYHERERARWREADRLWQEKKNGGGGGSCALTPTGDATSSSTTSTPTPKPCSTLMPDSS